MNKVFLFLLFLCFSTMSHAEIRNRLLQDKASYLSFLDLGKTYCMEELFKKTNNYKLSKGNGLYKRHFNTLYGLQSPLAYHYLDKDMKKAFADYQSKHLDTLIKKYREREEYFNINRSPFLICSKLFTENTGTKKLYRDFLYHPGYYLKDSHPESVRRMEATIGKWTDNP